MNNKFELIFILLNSILYEYSVMMFFNLWSIEDYLHSFQWFIGVAFTIFVIFIMFIEVKKNEDTD